jgi:hypothetical protein
MSSPCGATTTDGGSCKVPLSDGACPHHGVRRSPASGATAATAPTGSAATADPLGGAGPATPEVSPPFVESSRQRGEYDVYDPDPPVETHEDGAAFRTVRFNLTADADKAVRSTAAGQLLVDATGRDELDSRLDGLVDGQEKMTVLIVQPSGRVVAKEGMGFRASDGRPAIRHKGSRTKGVALDPERVVGVEAGYGHADTLGGAYGRHLEQVPATVPVDVDDLPDHPLEGHTEPTDDIGAVYLTDGPQIAGMPREGGYLFLATDRQDDEDGDTIVNGYFWAPDGAAAHAEHGSYFLAKLRNSAGKVAGYRPGSLTTTDVWRDGALGDDRTSAYRAVASGARQNA